VPAVLALISAVVWGVADFMGGLASRRSTAEQTLVISVPAGLLFVIPLAALIGGSVAASVLPGLVAGVFGGLGILMLYGALALGPMGVVSPVSAVLGAAIPVVVGLARGERPGVAAYVGMALAVVAIITVGLEPSSPTDDGGHQKLSSRALLLSIGAGIFIGLFFTVIALAPSDGGLWPIVFARGMSAAILVALGVVTARRRREPVLPVVPSSRWLALAAGGADVAANAFYLVAAQTGLLSVVAVLGSLYPAATVLLARFVLAERLRTAQKVGMVLALAAAALLALGSTG
jgi:drug/metabolite transporter (DMT)-like permease